MEIFIDTANIDEIREAASWGILSGVTTNPSLVAKEKRTMRECIEEIVEVVNGPISAEVLSLESEEMIKEAVALSDISENVNIKVPVCREGLKTVKELSSRGIKTNVTLIFSPNQALLAAKAGADYVSPFIGRLDDIGNRGMDVVEQIASIYAIHGIETRQIAASIRHPIHVIEAAVAGADIATVPFAILEKMIKHPLTDAGIEKFEQDWKNMPK